MTDSPDQPLPRRAIPVALSYAVPGEDGSVQLEVAPGRLEWIFHPTHPVRHFRVWARPVAVALFLFCLLLTCISLIFLIIGIVGFAGVMIALNLGEENQRSWRRIVIAEPRGLHVVRLRDRQQESWSVDQGDIRRLQVQDVPAAESGMRLVMIRIEKSDGHSREERFVCRPSPLLLDLQAQLRGILKLDGDGDGVPYATLALSADDSTAPAGPPALSYAVADTAHTVQYQPRVDGAEWLLPPLGWAGTVLEVCVLLGVSLLLLPLAHNPWDQIWTVLFLVPIPLLLAAAVIWRRAAERSMSVTVRATANLLTLAADKGLAHTFPRPEIQQIWVRREGTAVFARQGWRMLILLESGAVKTVAFSSDPHALVEEMQPRLREILDLPRESPHGVLSAFEPLRFRRGWL